MFSGRAFPSQPATPSFQRAKDYWTKNAPIVQEYFAVSKYNDTPYIPTAKAGGFTANFGNSWNRITWSFGLTYSRFSQSWVIGEGSGSGPC